MTAKPVRPVFEFREYGIAIHFVLELEDRHQMGRRVDPERELRSGPNFESLERDLLSSVNRELRLADDGAASAVRTLRLFGSRSLEPPAGSEQLEVRYPARLEYMAEGKDRPVFPPQDDEFFGEWRPEELTENERRRAFRFLPSLTEFRSGAVVLHLVLAPIEDDPASVVNEWDLVVLSKLWQGGEGVGPADGDKSLLQQVKFAPRGRGGGAGWTIVQLAQETLQREQGSDASRSYWDRKVADRLFFEPKAGTLELTYTDAVHTPGKIYSALQGLASGTGTHLIDAEVMAVEGILCGLLDYFDIGADELEDVFADPIMADDGTFLDIHKGTMLMLAGDIRRIDPVMGKPLGVNPYLLLPQSVLLHNEYWLRRANLRASEVAGCRHIREVQQAELDIRAALQQHRLPNIFHYRTERMWYDDGHQARGINDLARVVEQQLQNINGHLDELRATHEQDNALVFGLLGVGIAALQVLGAWETLENLWRQSQWDWLGVIGISVGLVVGYMFWRRFRK